MNNNHNVFTQITKLQKVLKDEDNLLKEMVQTLRNDEIKITSSKKRRQHHILSIKNDIFFKKQISKYKSINNDIINLMKMLNTSQK